MDIFLFVALFYFCDHIQVKTFFENTLGFRLSEFERRVIIKLKRFILIFIGKKEIIRKGIVVEVVNQIPEELLEI